MKYEKDGEVKTDVAAVIQLVVGVGVAVLVLIFVGTLGGRSYELVEDDLDALYSSVTKESATVLNATAVSLANDDIVTNSMVVNNHSNTVALTTFTFDYDAGTVTLLNNDYNNTALNFTYTHGTGGYNVSVAAKEGMIGSFSALESVGDFLPMIVLVFVIVLVLGMVFSLGLNKGGGYKGSAL